MRKGSKFGRISQECGRTNGRNASCVGLSKSHKKRTCPKRAYCSNCGDRSVRKSPDAKRNAENALALSIERCLAENVCARLSLDDVCQKFHMSKSYICRLFKEATGESVVDFYIRLKIGEAKRLLSQGRLNCSQVAERLGYSGVHHFCRSFKKAVGAPPGAYARRGSKR
jgi:AraC-like DNA-binding protein